MNHIFKSRQKQIEESLSALSSEERTILKAVAFSMHPHNDHDIKSIGLKYGIKNAAVTKYIKNWKGRNLISSCYGITSFYSNDYIVNFDIALYLIREVVAEESVKVYESKRLQPMRSVDVERTRNRGAIVDFLSTGRCSELTNASSDKVIENIVANFIYFDEFRGIENYLSSRLLTSLAKNVFNHSVNLICIDLEWQNAIFDRLQMIETQVDKSLYNERLVITHVLGNRLEHAAQMADLSNEWGYYIQALYQQKLGNMSSAVKLYKKGLTLYPFNKMPLPPAILFRYSYLLALMGDKAASSKTKLNTLYRKIYDIYDEREFISYILLKIHHEGVKEVATEFKGVSFYKNTNIGKLLEMIILNNYNIATISDNEVNDLTECLADSRFELLQIEASRTLPAFITKFENTTDATPLIPIYEHQETWKLALIEALQQVGGKGSQKVSSSTQTSRIVYLVNHWGGITPKLQKSKDGKTWTKGRNIAIKTFKEGMPEMSDIDHNMRVWVEEHNEYGGYGYPIHTYELSGVNALKALAGYSLVFSEDNPELPVDIVVEEPHLVIVSARGRYKIETNVSPSQLRSSPDFEWENNTRIKIVNINSKQANIIQLLTSVPSFPKEAEEKLKELIDKLSSEITIHSDLTVSHQATEQIKGDSNLVVQLIPLGDGFKAEFFVKPFTTEAPYCKIGIGAKNVVAHIDGKTMQASRHFDTENKNYDKAKQAFIQFDWTDNDVVMLENMEQGLEFLNLAKDLDYVVVEWPEGVKLKVKKQADTSNLWLNLKNKTNWFEMEGNLKIDDLSLSIQQVLEAFTDSKQRFIALGNDEFLALSNELRHTIQQLKALSIKSKNKLQISKFAASAIDGMGSDGAHIKGDAAYKQLIKNMSEAALIECEVPSRLNAELRDYQLDGFQWMARLSAWGSGACLADDMGLGKTIQTITMLLSRASRGASLVVAPASVIMNWRDEINRFAPALTVTVLNAEANRDAAIQSADKYDVVLTTYGLLVSEESSLCSKAWNVIALDEAHTIKNRETKMSKSSMQLKGDFRLALTGTPVQNHLSEIWNLFQFMNPGMLGSFEHFQHTFIVPIEQNSDKVRQKELRKLISPFLLRRTKNEVLQELPQKTEITIKVEMTDKERMGYESIRQKAEMAIENGDMNPIQTLAEITKLRQAASHMAIIDPRHSEESSKTAAFLSLYEEMIENNHRALVFSQFTSHLALIRKALDQRGISYLYLDGSTTIPQRRKLVKEFQTGEQPLFLISLKAGGLGLNLTGADFIVHLDPWWNVAIEDQASDRAHRIGQTRPVTVYRLIAQSTIEEKILKLHTTKKNLANSLLEGTNMSHKLTREEIMDLLKHDF